ncbi:MAG: DUF2934 domain-containing protein [Chitinispirillaceae bacterium]|nr:DUF2934 domain-containing protein [Chitinispirillaceae bacterium]
MSVTITKEEQIAKRAHELYEARGRKDGFALEDWILAEKEILGKAVLETGRKEKTVARNNYSGKSDIQQQKNTARIMNVA